VVNAPQIPPLNRSRQAQILATSGNGQPTHHEFEIDAVEAYDGMDPRPGGELNDVVMLDAEKTVSASLLDFKSTLKTIRLQEKGQEKGQETAAPP
jgi:hypothetical protein